MNTYRLIWFLGNQNKKHVVSGHISSKASKANKNTRIPWVKKLYNAEWKNLNLDNNKGNSKSQLKLTMTNKNNQDVNVLEEDIPDEDFPDEEDIAEEEDDAEAKYDPPNVCKVQFVPGMKIWRGCLRKIPTGQRGKLGEEDHLEAQH